MRFIGNKWWGTLLWPLSFLYKIIVSLRNYCYDHKIFPSYHLDCTVISVGNLHVGGTGKTPTVIFLAQWFLERGYKIAILSRGYKRKSTGAMLVADENQILGDARTAGDEPYLMAKRLPGVPIMVDVDRVRGGKTILAKFHPHIILLDDGMQHRRLYRNVDIVTVRSEDVFRRPRLLPAGPLREPLDQLRRAQLIWINGNFLNMHSLPEKWTSIPVIEAEYQVTSIYNQWGEKNPSQLRHCSAVIFCGVANPVSFVNTVNSLGVDIKQLLSYPDHHFYNEKDIEKIHNSYLECNADLILTTEKDWVKLTDHFTLDEKWYCMAVSVVPQNMQRANAILEEICQSMM